MMDVMTSWTGWVGKTPNDEAWLKQEMAELFRWISDYATEKYGSSFIITANIDSEASDYFPDMGQYIDGGYYQNAFWWWNGNGENYPAGAGSRGEPINFLLQQGIQPLYMDHIGTGPLEEFTWFENFDARATTEKYLETFGFAIDKSALPYIAPLLFGEPYAMAPRYARVDGTGLHAGTVYRDWVIGSSGNDKISGGAADDLLAGLSGDDGLDGGSGIDTAYFARSGKGVVVSLSAGTATGEGSDTLVAMENVIGSDFDDVIRGGTGSNRLEGGAGNDALDGGVGADTLIGGAGTDTLNGGTGADSMAGGTGDDSYFADALGDVVVELTGEGNDTFRSSLSRNLSTNVEQLVLIGSADINGTGNTDANTITGNTGNNVLSGAAGNDTLIGGQGNDTLLGGGDADSMTGGAGDDAYTVTLGDRTVEFAGGGTDTVNSGIAWTLGVNVEILILTGTAGVQGTGNGSNNLLRGNDGSNRLLGQDGADTLAGGAGNDSLTGGAGADVFLFDTALNAASNTDKIFGFVRGSDKIHLDDDVFSSLTAGAALTGAQFLTGAGANTALTTAQRVIYDSSTGALYYDADGAGGVGAVQFAVFGDAAKPAVGLDDFVIVV